MATHLCPPTAIGWKARASHPSKPCRATSALAGCAYSAAGQAASALHSLAVLQVFQAKMLASEEAGLDAASLRDLRSMTDLALRATKATAQAIGRSMSSLVVLECHLWLTLTEMKEADKVPFLDAPVSSNSLSGPAVEGFAERFTEAQKSSHAMRHFLPKRASSAASSRPKPVPTQQPAKPKPATPEPLPPKGRQDRGRSRSARCYPKRQGPGLRSPWIRRLRSPPDQPGRKRRGQSLAIAGPPRKQPLMCLLSPRSALGAEKSVFFGSPRAHSSARASDKIKHMLFQKESKYPLLPTISVLPLCSQSLEPIQPLATRAEACQAIPGVSEWIMATIRRGYSLQFARRPPRFSGVVTTTVRSEDAQVLRAEVMNLLVKGAIEVVTPAQSESGFYSCYFLVPKNKKFVQDDHIETDPLANTPWGLVHVAGSERRILSHPGSPPSQTILEIRIRGGGISIQGPPVWAVPGSHALLRDVWMRLSPLCDRWEFASSTTSTTGSFWPSQRQF